MVEASGVRTWTCSKCKATHDRDINAAINIFWHGSVPLA
ncbi:MAG: zinc ribbon domain-containing protein [Deinococcales bacterium]